jgi:hypothetical protein
LEGVFFQLFDSEYFIDIFAEVHPLYSFLSISFRLNGIDSLKLIEFLVGDIEIETV